jgi:hypothetical protein
MENQPAVPDFPFLGRFALAILAATLPEALFGTRVFVGISGDNPLEYWVKPLPSPNPHKTTPIIH